MSVNKYSNYLLILGDFKINAHLTVLSYINWSDYLSRLLSYL